MPLVAIVGRPNVGKSTLFNRFTEERRAIVDDVPGVTRDRVFGTVEWSGRTFSLVDTGGFIQDSTDRIEAAVREQVHIAIDEADVLLFVVDVKSGITDLDEQMAVILRKGRKPVITLVNKADNEELRWETSSFYQLGLGEVYGVGALNGIGT
ncbi:MAG: 50S ribosome-binding GTPase, partial [Bacteroidetes bacterium]|nr:50S ribosome-binding GTPase [Bacteroidota bacterium]